MQYNYTLSRYRHLYSHSLDSPKKCNASTIVTWIVCAKPGTERTLFACQRVGIRTSDGKPAGTSWRDGRERGLELIPAPKPKRIPASSIHTPVQFRKVESDSRRVMRPSPSRRCSNFGRTPGRHNPRRRAAE